MTGASTVLLLIGVLNFALIPYFLTLYEEFKRKKGSNA